MGKTEKKGTEEYPDHGARPAPAGIVEAAMLGEIPGGTGAEEFAGGGAWRASPEGDPRAARIRLVRDFIDGRPELREELEGEFGKAWVEAEAEPARFMRATAQTRARVISEAELDLVRKEAPRAVSSMDAELSRYLAEVEGRAGP